LGLASTRIGARDPVARLRPLRLRTVRPLFAIETLGLFAVQDMALGEKQDMQPPVAKPPLLARQFAQAAP
jgi:hypothetical protein